MSGTTLSSKNRLFRVDENPNEASGVNVCILTAGFTS